MSLFNVFIGYDPNETVAYHVLAHSILRRASIPGVVRSSSPRSMAATSQPGRRAAHSGPVSPIARAARRPRLRCSADS